MAMSDRGDRAPRGSLVGAGLGALTILASGAACTRDLSAGSADLGVAAEGDEIDYCILNVHTDEETVHFEGPTALLGSVEGAGPIQLDLRLLDFLIPTVTFSGKHVPKESTVSRAIGHSLQERYGVDEFTRLSVAEGQFQRVEAYANYQRTVFDVFDSGCTTFLGTGAAYRPIGLYFKAVLTGDDCLPDIGVHVCVPVPDPSPPPEQEDAGADDDDGHDASADGSEAGTEKGGASDAGESDAGG
jgi:hypothetical protein